MTSYTGIEGLRGRVPVGCALTIGVKGDRGYPIERDRFHVVWPQEDESGRRPYHPRFGPFNTADPRHRRAIFGTFAHAAPSDCFEYALRCQGPKGHPSPPSRRPFCIGNGVRAMRYTGTDAASVEQFEDIACPHGACEFRQENSKGGKDCKPHMRFLFQLSWQEGAPLPSMLCKFTSGSWGTVGNFVGFFRQIESIAFAFGLAPAAVNLAGFRFALQLTERSNKARKSRYPVVTITPVDDIADFLHHQTERALQISGHHPIAALTDSSESDPNTQHTDWKAHEVTPLDGE